MKPKASSLKNKKTTDIIDKPLARITRVKQKTQRYQYKDTDTETKIKNIMNNFLPIN